MTDFSSATTAAQREGALRVWSEARAGSVLRHAGHVSMVFVDPERWGRGVGSLLMDALHDEMEARGWSTFSVWTRTANSRARRLYEGRGYSPTGEVKQLRGEEIVRYELRLHSLPACTRSSPSSR